MLKKAWKWMNSSEKREEFDEKIHKKCEECAGSGLDFIAGYCEECNGNGFINKSRSEIWKEKLND